MAHIYESKNEGTKINGCSGTLASVILSAREFLSEGRERERGGGYNLTPTENFQGNNNRKRLMYATSTNYQSSTQFSLPLSPRFPFPSSTGWLWFVIQRGQDIERHSWIRRFLLSLISTKTTRISCHLLFLVCQSTSLHSKSSSYILTKYYQANVKFNYFDVNTHKINMCFN